jgi:hypothetical protein
MVTKLVRTWAVTIAFTLGALVACLLINYFGEAIFGIDFSQSIDSRRGTFTFVVLLAALSGAIVDAARLIGCVVWQAEPSFRVEPEKIKRQNLA